KRAYCLKTQPATGETYPKSDLFNKAKLTLTEKPWGTFILASTFEDDKTAAETHYDAVWLRDSLWGYMALVSDQGNSVAAKKVLLTGSDSNLLIVFYVQIMPDDLVMQLHR
ncbi:hypothetical protein OFN04_28005, partial [Escherichia coli]|nr:hypothetical protein [Escherichia coli]